MFGLFIVVLLFPFCTIIRTNVYAYGICLIVHIVNNFLLMLLLLIVSTEVD